MIGKVVFCGVNTTGVEQKLVSLSGAGRPLFIPPSSASPIPSSENAKHRLGHEDSHGAWEGEGEEQEELKKREERPNQQKEAAASEKTRERDGEWKEEGQGLKEYQKTEKIEEKVKEVSHGENNQKALEEEAAKEKMEDEGEEDGSRKKKKRRTSSETWSSREYFGRLKNRGTSGPKIREVMLRGSRDSVKRGGSDKRSFELEGEEGEDDSSEEKPMSRHHHQDWEDEEDEGEKKRRGADRAKRVDEKASNEETAQFEEEEKGVKISNSKGHLHGGWKPWPEEEEEGEEEGEMRYGHHHRSGGLGLKKRRGEDYLKDRHHGREEGEGEGEANQKEVSSHLGLSSALMALMGVNVMEFNRSRVLRHLNGSFIRPANLLLCINLKGT